MFGALGGGDPSKAGLLCDGPWAGECDGVHPNDSGFKIIAQTIKEALSKNQIKKWSIVVLVNYLIILIKFKKI